MRWLNYGLFLVLCSLCGMAVFGFLTPDRPVRDLPIMAYSDLLQAAAAGQIRDGTLQGRTFVGTAADGRRFTAELPDTSAAVVLAAANVRVTVQPEERSVLVNLLAWLPLLVFLGVMGAVLRRVDIGFKAVNARLDSIATRLDARPER